MHLGFKKAPTLFLAMATLLAIASLWLGYHSSEPKQMEPLNGQDLSVKAITKDELHDEQLRSLLKRWQSGDRRALERLLPLGMTEISGSGGDGLQRQVLAHGHWYPVFDLSALSSTDQNDLSAVRLNVIPLTLTNPHPPAGKISEPLNHRFIAIGGTPPYTWQLEASEEVATIFTFDPNSGTLSGISTKELIEPIEIYLTDAAGTVISAASTLTVASGKPLTITTSALPAADDPSTYQTTLQAEGGVPPYAWSLSADLPGWSCDSATGLIRGVNLTPGSHQLRVTLKDQVTSVRQSYVMTLGQGLEILTESPLPPAKPGEFYTGSFQARGGSPPYTWSMDSTGLPPGWQITQEGQLTGTATMTEGLLSLPVRVTDSLGLYFDKVFEVSVSRGLIIVPSDQKAGLAWRLSSMRQSLRSEISSVILSRDGQEIYRGRSSTFVDRGLTTGSSPQYSLTAILRNGRRIPYATADTHILPFTKGRAIQGVNADPHADGVREFSPLSGGGHGAARLPANVLGPPDGRSTFSPAHQPEHIVSLHASSSGGGSIVLEFKDNIIESGSGMDFTVFENVFFIGNDPSKRFMEPALVEVAVFEDEWHRLPAFVQVSASGHADLRQAAYYVRGFAGVNATTGDDPTNPARSGGDSFDLSNLGQPDLTWVRFVRLIATGDAVMPDQRGLPIRHTSENQALSGRLSSGFDLDAVTATNY